MTQTPPWLPDKHRDFAYARSQYELDIKPLSIIAKEIGVSQHALFSRVSAEGWTKDAQAKARIKAELELAKETAEAEVAEKHLQKAIRVNAEMQARVLVEHRYDIARARKLTMRLFSELEFMTYCQGELEQLGELLAEDVSARQHRLFQYIIALPERSKTMRALSDSLKTQIQLERQAFGIVGALEDPEKPVTAIAGESDIDKILGKFDLVLKSKETAISNQSIVGEIVDVPELRSKDVSVSSVSR